MRDIHAALGVGAVATLGVASETRVGPVVFVLRSTHGVHLGDLAVAAAAVVACTDASWARLRQH